MEAVGSDALARDYAHCAELVREQDQDRYYAALFAPADKRGHLFALYAFSAEIARIRDAVSAPLPGEIRLQWWRDAIAGEARGDAGSHPVAAALADTTARFRLPQKALTALVDAREFDLYDDPMPSLADLEGYLGETSSALIRLASLILADGGDPGSADASGHAGVAYGLVGLLRALPWHARRGQLYLPRDVLDRYGVTRDDVVLGRGGPGLDRALADMRTAARGHLADLAKAPPVPAGIWPALLPTRLVGFYLTEMERRSYDPFRTMVDVQAWRKLLRMWLASRP